MFSLLVLYGIFFQINQRSELPESILKFVFPDYFLYLFPLKSFPFTECPPQHYTELISPFPVPIFVSQIDISILPQPGTPKNIEVPFLKPMKTTTGHWHCFHCGWTIVQLSLPSVFSGLPETSLLKTGSWLCPLVKPERFPLESELCASLLSSTETSVICQVSLVGQ